MLAIDLKGKRAFVAGIGDDNGFGWAIAKALHQAGASVCAGTWPPVLNLFTKGLERKFTESAAYRAARSPSRKSSRSMPCSTPRPMSRPRSATTSATRNFSAYTIQECADKHESATFGDKPLDVVVHSLANGMEVKKPMLETSRARATSHAVGASAYSHGIDGAALRPSADDAGGSVSFVSLSYLAAERVVPGYGGGMSSAKAALESDTRVLAYEAGRKFGHPRQLHVSAGPMASRAAKAIGTIEMMVEYYRKNSARSAKSPPLKKCGQRRRVSQSSPSGPRESPARCSTSDHGYARDGHGHRRRF